MYLLIHPIHSTRYSYGRNTLKICTDLIIEVADHLGSSHTFSALVPCDIAMLSTVIPSNIVMLHNTLESATPTCLGTNVHKSLHSHYDKILFI